jgi:mycothiol synthase
MRRVDVMRQMTPDGLAAVTALLDAAERVDGRRPLGDHHWVDLVHGAQPGFAAVLAWEPPLAHPVAYAQVSRGIDGWEIQLVVDPDHRARLVELGVEALGAALAVVRSEGGGRVNWWAFTPADDHERIAERLGLRPDRGLYQMRRPLPTEAVTDVATRPFEVGRDEDAWLRVNNRAFATHPEQGGWDVDTLRAREAEPWFDPAGFLLHERDGRLAAFCWTKVHDDHEPRLGEIYVIAVDPDFHGLGLGRDLTLAGLDWLHRGGIDIGMLYVDAGNDAAVGLYRKLGFTVHHTDRAFVGEA